MVNRMKQRLTSVQHPLVKHLSKLRQNRAYRYEHQSILVEGIKPIEELVHQGRFKTLILYNEAMIPLGAEATEIVVVNEAVMRKISGMENPEGLIVEMSMPQNSNLEGAKTILALDGINDPGNMGTLIRTSLALGFEGVFILEGSCDPFNEKTIRASRGAIFKQPLATGNFDLLKDLIKKNQLYPLVADLQGKDCSKIEINEKVLLVMGNESHGASKEVKAFCFAVTIVMPGAMESLNVAVAGGILMYMLKGRQKT